MRDRRRAKDTAHGSADEVEVATVYGAGSLLACVWVALMLGFVLASTAVR